MPNQRHWCVTFWKKPDVNIFTGRYIMLGGEETCPTTGKKHHHAYMEFQDKVSMKYIKEMFNDKTIHVEPKIDRSTREQARDYCTKEGGPFETKGVWVKGPGFRTDLHTTVSQIVSGEIRLRDVMLNDPVLYCKYRNGLKDIQELADEENSWNFRGDPEVIVISGPTGVNKSKWAIYEQESRPYVIRGSTLSLNSGEGWWNGYNGQDILVIDEYDNNVKLPFLLNLTHGHQCRLGTKQGHTYAQWSKVIITTNLTRDEWHPHAKEMHHKAFQRRLTEWRDLYPPSEKGRGTPGNTILEYPDPPKKHYCCRKNETLQVPDKPELRVPTVEVRSAHENVGPGRPTASIGQRSEARCEDSRSLLGSPRESPK